MKTDLKKILISAATGIAIGAGGMLLKSGKVETPLPLSNEARLELFKKAIAPSEAQLQEKAAKAIPDRVLTVEERFELFKKAVNRK